MGIKHAIRTIHAHIPKPIVLRLNYAQRASRYFLRSFFSIDEYHSDEQELLVGEEPRGRDKLASRPATGRKTSSRVGGIGKATYVEVESRRVE